MGGAACRRGAPVQRASVPARGCSQQHERLNLRPLLGATHTHTPALPCLAPFTDQIIKDPGGDMDRQQLLREVAILKSCR